MNWIRQLETYACSHYDNGSTIIIDTGEIQTNCEKSLNRQWPVHSIRQLPTISFIDSNDATHE